MKLELLRRFFLNRSDYVANFAPWAKPCPIQVDSDATMTLVLRAHLGEVSFSAKHVTSSGDKGIHPVTRVGSYCPSPDNLTRWMCIDFDGKGHASALRSPLGTAQLAIHVAKTNEIPCYLEQSGGGRGWHVWVFFDRPVEAGLARRLGLMLVPKDAPLIGGGSANVFANEGIEVFPKGEIHEKSSGKGSLVWLPWWGGAPDEASTFFDHEANGPIDIDSFDVFEARRFNQIQELLPSLERATVPPVTLSAPYEHAGDWEEFKQRVSERVDLRAIYRLTGKKAGRGWLQARDYGVEDKNPSAVVSDGSVADRALFHSYRSGETLDVFAYMQKAHGSSSFIDAAKRLSELTGVKLPDTRKPGREASFEAQVEELKEEPKSFSDEKETTDDRNPLNVKDDELVLIAGAWQAINQVRARDQTIFHWGMVPVCVKRGRTVPMKRGLMRAELAKRIRWFKFGPQTEDFAKKPAPPSDSLVNAILESSVDNAKELVAITRSPVFVEDGRLIFEPGYDEKARLYYSKTCEVPPLPKNVESDDVMKAHELIFGYLLRNFPFDTPASNAHAVAALLNPFVRHMIQGPTPLYLFEAPSQASGKSLLAGAVTKIFTGAAPTVTLSPNNEEENRKSIFSSVLANPGGVVFVDNVKGHVDSSFLEATLTGETIEQRVLGLSQNAYAMNLSTYLLTANNPSLSIDLHRRSLKIRLDPAMARPEFRDPKNFRVPNLARWIKENRGKLIWSLLVFVKYWLQKGAVRAPYVMGSFEDYAAVMGGVLQANEVVGFLDGRATEQSEDFIEWQSFLGAWHERFDSDPTTVAYVFERILGQDEFRDYFANAFGRVNGKDGRISVLGRMLKNKRGVRFGEFYIERDGRKWRCFRERDTSEGIPF